MSAVGRRLLLSAMGVAAAAAVGAAAVLVVVERPSACGVAASADIGGYLPPRDHLGRLRDAPLGEPALVYFGYTFCPDVCPLDVFNLSEAAHALDERGIAVAPVFVTVDPARDTVEVLADFVAPLHPRMLALTGSGDEIARAARSWRVYYARGEGEGEDYLMNHSAFTYLADADGEMVAHYAHNTPPSAIAESVACHDDEGSL